MPETQVSQVSNSCSKGDLIPCFVHYNLHLEYHSPLFPESCLLKLVGDSHNNNYFAPVIVGFVTAWIALCERCKIPFFKQNRY